MPIEDDQEVLTWRQICAFDPNWTRRFRLFAKLDGHLIERYTMDPCGPAFSGFDRQC